MQSTPIRATTTYGRLSLALLLLAFGMGCAANNPASSSLSPESPAASQAGPSLRGEPGREAQALSVKRYGRITAIEKNTVAINGLVFIVQPTTSITSAKTGGTIPFSALRVGMRAFGSGTLSGKTVLATSLRVG